MTMPDPTTVPDLYAALGVPSPGFRWATYEGVAGIPQLAIGSPQFDQGWRAVGPLNPADEAPVAEPISPPDAGTTTPPIA